MEVDEVEKVEGDGAAGLRGREMLPSSQVTFSLSFRLSFSRPRPGSHQVHCLALLLSTLWNGLNVRGDAAVRFVTAPLLRYSFRRSCRPLIYWHQVLQVAAKRIGY